MKIDRFVLLLIATIVVAYFFPQLANNRFVSLDTISNVGISFIFFFYGLKLSLEKLRAGLQNWRLHILVQASTFILFPLVILLFYPLVDTSELRMLWLAVFFLAALPSTVSTSVVMVSMAKGNIPAAIFNASLSGIIGIGITPLWMGLFIQSTDTSFELSTIYLDLLVEIIAPIFLGIMLQSILGRYMQQYGSKLALFDRAIILLIIYKSFATSFTNNLFDGLSLSTLVFLIIIVTVLFFLIYSLIGFMADRLNFSREDKITAQFCGTKKSLVHGTVFSKILFSQSAALGILLLPIMLFHAIQIVIISAIASKIAQRTVSKL